MLDQLKEDLKKAQLDKDSETVSTLRLLLSELSYAAIKKGGNLSQEDIISVVQREIKKRNEAAEGFRKGGREEQALKEEAEIKVLSKYQPEQLSNEELTKLVDEAITEVGANGMQDMGKVIGLVMSRAGQGAAGSMVSSLVREKLSSQVGS